MTPSPEAHRLPRPLDALQSAFRASRWVDVVAVAGILSLALPLGHLLGPDVRYLGVDPSALHKLFVIACTFPVLLRGGPRHWLNPVIVTATFLLLLGFVVSSRSPELSPMQSLQTYGAIILGVYVLEHRFSSRFVHWLVTLMPWAAAMNLGVAIALWLLDGRLFYRWYFDAFRLQGVGNPPMLSAVALAALMFSLLASVRRPAWMWLAAANFSIIVWTGTRTRAVEGALLLLGWAVVLFASAIKDRRRVPRLQIGVLVLSIPVSLLSYTPHVAERLGGYTDNVARETLVLSIPQRESGVEAAGSENAGEGDEWEMRITATGRMAAWSFYWGLFRENPWFGSGLGAAIVAEGEALHAAFVQPHNDYLRILVDAGIIGLILMIGGHFLIMLRLLRGAENRSRRWLVLVAFGVLAIGALVQSELTSLGFNVPFWLFVGILAGELPVSVDEFGSATQG